MSGPTWNDGYATGNPNIDSQHRELFDIIDTFERTLAAGAGNEAVRPILVRLRNYVSFHFALEEALMQRHAVPASHAEPHRAAHQSFNRRVRDAMFAVDNNHARTEDLREMQRFLLDWLVAHIQKVDKHLVELLHPT